MTIFYLSIIYNKFFYFGPITNNPGPTKYNIIQYGICPLNKSSFECRNTNLNGFFMVFSKNVLIKNKFNSKYYFNPNYQFGGNVVEWYIRFKSIGGKGAVVPRTFIYHYKNMTWRKTSLNDKCLYTINTGYYE